MLGLGSNRAFLGQTPLETLASAAACLSELFVPFASDRPFPSDSAGLASEDKDCGITMPKASCSEVCASSANQPVRENICAGSLKACAVEPAAVAGARFAADTFCPDMLCSTSGGKSAAAAGNSFARGNGAGWVQNCETSADASIFAECKINAMGCDSSVPPRGEPPSYVRGMQVSSVYRTSALYLEDQDDFFNLVVAGWYQKSPESLLADIHFVEAEFGRDRSKEVRNGPRTLDIDIELFGNRRIYSKDLEVPHPRLYERAFVLVPMVEILRNSADDKKKDAALYEPYLRAVAAQSVRRVCSAADFARMACAKAAATF